MDRLQTDPSSSHFDRAAFPDHPYSGRAPFDATWVTIAEVESGKDGDLDRAEPNSWGTLGEYLDVNIESGAVGPEEIREFVAAFERDGTAIMDGGVGSGFEVVRIEGPEAVNAKTFAP